MKTLTIVTNNGLMALAEYTLFGELDIRTTLTSVLDLPKQAEIIIEKYGVGAVRCEVCSVAGALVAMGFLRLNEEFNTNEENDHEPDSP